MVCFLIASDLNYSVITSVYSSLIQSVTVFLRKANIFSSTFRKASLVAQMVKNLSAMQETWV